MTSPEPFEDTRIIKIQATKLDQLIQVLEISFIFLICFTLITLVNEALLKNTLNLYSPIAGMFLGEDDVGSLDGGNFGEIVRVTLVFNLILFSISLVFGLWIRRTRDGWSLNQLGYTFRTPKYPFTSLARRGILLGLIVIVAFYTIMTPIIFFLSGGDLTSAFLFHAYENDGVIFSGQQLNAEYYFGFIEMGFIWPASAGFFFFSYVHNSFKARFPLGVANLISTIFYVIYLAFFFMIPVPNKLDVLFRVAIYDPIFWGMFFSFSVVLYISFSAFAETGSIVLPFLLNFVFNAGLTLIRALNSLIFYDADPSSYFLMLIPYILAVAIIAVWFFLRREDFSTIRLGIQSLREVFSKKTREEFSLIYMVFIVFLFFLISFFLPGVLEHIVVSDYPPAVFAFSNALIYILLISLALIILNYAPTKVYDILFVKHPDGIPIASRQKLFQSDEVLISGFFQAISSVSDELDSDNKAGLRTIKRGDREILIEDGVFTRVIVLADRDQSRIRDSILKLQRAFEAAHAIELANWIGDQSAIPEAKDLIEEIGRLEIKFDIPQQARWIAVLALLFTPIMIGLIALLF